MIIQTIILIIIICYIQGMLAMQCLCVCSMLHEHSNKISNQLVQSVCLVIYIYIYMYMHAHKYMYIYIYIYVYAYKEQRHNSVGPACSLVLS